MIEKLLQPLPPGDGCLTTTQLKAFLLGDSSEVPFERMEAHVNYCLDCQAELERIGDLDDPVSLNIKEIVGAAAEVFDSQMDIESVSDHSDSNEYFGDFQIVRELGRGGMGIVYEANQFSLSRTVALKILPFTAVLDPRQLRRFETEARAAARLDHEHIVQVYQFGCEQGVHYYAMRYINGRNVAELIGQLRQLTEHEGIDELQTDEADFELASSLTNGYFMPPNSSAPDVGQNLIGQPSAMVDTDPTAKLSTIDRTDGPAYFRTVADLGIQAAEAVEFAHQNGVLHRDIKPSNLMVDESGKLWVTDFGLARIEGELGLSITGDVMGTLRYMSPEQRSGDSSSVDERSDVYALGVTLYEMLTLQPLFPSSNRQELLKFLEQEEPLRPRQINKPIPAALEMIVLKALARKPADRYATAQELADDLRRFLNHEPILARPMPMLRRVVNWARRHPSMITSIATSLFLCIILAGTVIVIRDDKGKEVVKIVLPEGGMARIYQEPEPKPEPPQQKPPPEIKPPRKVSAAPLIPRGTPIFVQSPQTLGVTASIDVALADFDEDGNLDALFATASTPGNLIWFGTGDGKFKVPPFNVGGVAETATWGVAIGDLNLDGHLDFVCANAYVGEPSNGGNPNTVWLGRGDGTFLAGPQPFGKAKSKRVTLGDINSDGRLDALISNRDDYSTVWLGNGDGSFSKKQRLGSAGNTLQIALGDLNSDSILDTFMAKPGGGNRTFLGLGFGTFRPPHPETHFGSLISNGVVMADLNGDSHIDLFLANQIPNLSEVCLGNGEGQFRLHQELGEPVQSEAIALGDLDGDGQLDAVIANGSAHGPPANHVWRGDGRGGFHFVQSLGNSYSDGVALGDLDGDGDLDAVFANELAQPDTIWINQTLSPMPSD